MSTEILVGHIEKSVNELKRQVSKVEQLKKGFLVMRDEIHMDEEESAFSSWMQSEGVYIKKHIPGDIITNIELLHTAWHGHYKKIYDLYFSAKKSSWFGNANRPKALDDQEKEKFLVYYDDLMEVHAMLIHKFSILHLRVSSSREIDDSAIKSVKKLMI